MSQHNTTPARITLDVDSVSAGLATVHANRGAILAAVAWLLERLPAIIAGLQSFATAVQGAPATRAYFRDPMPEAPEAAPGAAPRIVSEEAKAKAKKAKAKGTKKATRKGPKLERLSKDEKARRRAANQGQCRAEGCETVLTWDPYAKAKGWTCPDCLDGAKADDPEPIDHARAAAAAASGEAAAEGPRDCRVCDAPVVEDAKGHPADAHQEQCSDACRKHWHAARQALLRYSGEGLPFPEDHHKSDAGRYLIEVAARGIHTDRAAGIKRSDSKGRILRAAGLA